MSIKSSKKEPQVSRETLENIKKDFITKIFSRYFVTSKGCLDTLLNKWRMNAGNRRQSLQIFSIRSENMWDSNHKAFSFERSSAVSTVDSRYLNNQNVMNWSVVFSQASGCFPSVGKSQVEGDTRCRMPISFISAAAGRDRQAVCSHTIDNSFQTRCWTVART